MGDMERSVGGSYDVIIVGAGVSGINSAYRIQTELPTYTYTVLESRGDMGGTWDLFKYPGIRSDSDLHTFGFPFRPWTEPDAIAQGPAIKSYMKDTARIFGIDKHIQYHHRMLAANWSSNEQIWTLTVDADGEKTNFTAKFMILSTGYYDYNEPMHAVIPGIERFQGTTVHPQFWPEDLDYTDKKMVIIGSGATAVTMVPIIAQKAALVTMLQRSPTYIMTLPQRSSSATFIRKWLPSWLAYRLIRFGFLFFPLLFFNFCRAYPNAARKLLRARTTQQLPLNVPHDPHFVPYYDPWEQRLCVCPDGDFYRALRRGKADVVTGRIRSVTETGIELESGDALDADIICTATGLKVQLAGGARIAVDGKEVSTPDKFLWRGCMLQDLPNASFVIGYTNASWTLGADCTAWLVVRLLRHMQKHGYAVATPAVQHAADVGERPVLNLTSTYVTRAGGVLPKAGDKGPWKPRSDYFRDFAIAKFSRIAEGIEFSPEKKGEGEEVVMNGKM